MRGVPIVPVQWLRDYLDRISAVVFAFNCDHEEKVKHQVLNMIAPRTIPFFSGKILFPKVWMRCERGVLTGHEQSIDI